MKGSARARLLTVGISVAAGFGCTGESRAPAAFVDLLARRPDDQVGGAGVHVSPEDREVRLGPGAEVRYRIEPRGAGEVRLAARATGGGTLAAGWFTIDRAAGTATRGGQWEIEGASGELEHAFPLGSETDLLELRLAWRAPHGGAELELHALELHESVPLERPSIVLIVIDTLSARHLSSYGYPLETDPDLKRFASESFLFENCFANAPWTVPSFMALMTGLYAGAHELEPHGKKLWESWYVAQNRWTLAEALRAAGYRTGGFVDHAFLAKEFGFAQGFDVYDETAGADNGPLRANPDGGIRLTAARALAWLEDLGRDAPAFVFVHAFDVHQPYTETPPDEERARGIEPYDPERSAPVGGTSWAYGVIPTVVARVARRGDELPAAMPTAPIERAYDEGVRFLDEELGEFFDALRDEGLLERSWVVVTADHGEAMSDSSLLFGHGVLDQDVIRVPLLVRPPGGCPGGRRIADAVQLTDLYPTLIELAGVHAEDERLHGRSLVPLLRDGARAPDVVLAEGGNMQQAMVVAGGWKLVELEPTQHAPPELRLSHPRLRASFPPLAELEGRRGRPEGRYLAWLDDAELRRDFFERMPATGMTEELLAQMKTRGGFPSLLAFVDRVLAGPFYELYDLGADPEARHDVAAQHPEKVAELKALLRQEKRRRIEAWKLAQSPLEPVELAPETVEALEGLGYGGGGGDEPDEDGE